MISRKNIPKNANLSAFLLHRLIPSLTAVLVPGGLLLLFLLLRNRRTAMNTWVDSVSTPLKYAISHLCDPLPFSLAELLWLLSAIALLHFLIRTLVLLLRRGNRLQRLLCRSLALLSAFLFLCCGYTYLWGANYYSDSFAQRAELSTSGMTVGELTTLTVFFAQRCSQLAGQVRRNDSGCFAESQVELLQRATGQFDSLTAIYPFLAGPERRVKPLLCSRLVSCSGFSGFFFPFTGETLLDVDQPACLIPATILHEQAHQRGVADEGEANFLAILAGLYCDDPAFQYSAALLGFIHLSNALASVNKTAWATSCASLSQSVQTDLAWNNAYWQQFRDSTAEATSAIVFNRFLASYDQSQGLVSYGNCVDLLAAYYFNSSPV